MTIDDLTLLAGEYALGVLESEERAAFETLLETNPHARVALRDWEIKFASLNTAYEPIAPPAHVLESINQQISQAENPQGRDSTAIPPPAKTIAPPTTATPKTAAPVTVGNPANDDAPSDIPGDYKSHLPAVLGIRETFGKDALASNLLFHHITDIQFWQAYGAMASAAVLGLGVVNFIGAPLPKTTDAPITLTVQNATNAAAFVYNASFDRLELKAHSFTHPETTDLEAWLIVQGAEPQSLGVLVGNSDGEIVIQLPDGARNALAAGAVLAITQEPKGGAPAGIPTGPRLASGEIRVS